MVALEGPAGWRVLLDCSFLAEKVSFVSFGFALLCWAAIQLGARVSDMLTVVDSI